MMKRFRTKVCGITRPEDAQLAVDLGVDAIGIILYAQSPRLIALEAAKRIRAVVPAFVSLVGVFVDASPNFVKTHFSRVGLDLVQLHGAESGDYAHHLDLPYMKAIRARDAQQINLDIRDHPDSRAYLLDPYVKGVHGGTGIPLPDELWPEAKKINKPLILAGGLSADNVAAAANKFCPFAVDFNSGVEESPGIKSHAKLRAALGVVAKLSIA